MPYFSVEITGGSDPEVKAVEARHFYGGREIDYTGNGSKFYVQRNLKKEQVQNNLQSWVGSEYKVEVRTIRKIEYDWKKHR